MDRHIFLIGPGGIGKTSCGPHLARLMSHEFVDLDELFMSGPGHIGCYIKCHGYAQYVRKNSEFFFQQFSKCILPRVWALSSGFLIAETEIETVERNRAAIAKEGSSVLLLPHENPNECAKIVVNRQMQRGLNLRSETELPKFLARLPIYQSLADQIVVYQGTPNNAAKAIHNQLRNK